MIQIRILIRRFFGAILILFLNGFILFLILFVVLCGYLHRKQDKMFLFLWFRLDDCGKKFNGMNGVGKGV